MKDLIQGLGQEEAFEHISTVFDPWSALFTGWFFSIILQSATIVAIFVITLIGADTISLNLGFYTFLGLFLGNSVTPIIAVLLLKYDKKAQLRNAFKIGFSNIMYSFLIFSLALILELSINLFTLCGKLLTSRIGDVYILKRIPTLVDALVSPLINLATLIPLHPLLYILLIIGVLLIAFRMFDGTIEQLLGGEKKAERIIQENLKSRSKVFAFSLGLGFILPSASLLVSLAVPLAARGVIKLKQAIPYIIGTNLATFIDVVFASLANGLPGAIASSLMLVMMSSLGIVFLIPRLGISLIYRPTNLFCSLLPMKRRSVFLFLLSYTLVPVLCFFLIQLV
ncbi:MAG: hypothetical protein Tsb0021_14880 [Chlamydiales bacterium]